MDRGLKIHRSTRTSTVDRDAAEVWSVVAGGGPGSHWYVDALPFVVRGGIDRAVGGEGRRWPVPGRPLRSGDTAGFWRVSGVEGRTLRLDADVRSPGRVRLVTRVREDRSGRCTVSQSVSFEPDGLRGQLYLVADLPAREVVVELAHRRLLADLNAA